MDNLVKYVTMYMDNIAMVLSPVGLIVSFAFVYIMEGKLLKSPVS